VPRARRRAVAVFGSSEPAPGSPDYRRAFEVGRRLAEAGFTVVNGGYGGVMEASARGAREAGGRTIGVTTRAFTFRSGANRWIETEVTTDDLHERTRHLIEAADGFVVLPGRSGTLAELALLWALHKARLLGRRPIVLLGRTWERLLPALRRLDLLDAEVLEITTLSTTPIRAVRTIERRLGGDPAGRPGKPRPRHAARSRSSGRRSASRRAGS
jgi:uncharacterized protein (TIGR00730 family)